MFKLIMPYTISQSFIESKEDIVTYLNNFDNYYIDYIIINHIIAYN